MKYRLVIADVDGTLIEPNADKSTAVSERLLKAVEKCQNLGVRFSLATARSLEWVDDLIRSLKLNSYIILDNGARIYDCMTERYIFNTYIPAPKAEEIMRLLKQFPYEKFYVDKEKRRIYDPDNPPKFKDLVKIVILHISPYEAQEVFEIVSSIKDVRITKSVSGVNPVKESIHITNYDAAKHKALKRIIDLSGISMDQVLAIGDSYNDFSLLTSSGYKVAMGNAVPEIKAIADYIAPSYQEDGVAHVLEKFILKENV